MAIAAQRQRAQLLEDAAKRAEQLAVANDRAATSAGRARDAAHRSCAELQTALRATERRLREVKAAEGNDDASGALAAEQEQLRSAEADVERARAAVEETRRVRAETDAALAQLQPGTRRASTATCRLRRALVVS